MVARPPTRRFDRPTTNVATAPPTAARTIQLGWLLTLLLAWAVLPRIADARVAPHAAPLHEGLEEAIARVTAELAETPDAAALYLRRAGLQRLHGEFAACEVDLERAGELEPDLPGLALGRSRLARALGEWTVALGWVDLELGAESLGVDLRFEALELRAELLESAGRSADALAAWTTLIDLHPTPSPDWFLARASFQEPEAAVRGLDEGLARIGDSISLRLAACDLEERLGRIDAACARLQRIADTSARPENWFARQGDLLVRAGRPTDARDRYLAARAQLQERPRQQRLTASARRLATHIDTALAELPR
jgi:tetratricopeptide (TPR) repeat protein